MRTLWLDVTTVPSTIASTWSRRAMSGSDSCVFLYCITEVREMTRN